MEVLERNTLYMIKFLCQDLNYKDHHWHGSCFLCISCKTSLVDVKFVVRSGQIYCGSCHENQFGSRCVGCADVFRTGRENCNLNLILLCLFRHEEDGVRGEAVA